MPSRDELEQELQIQDAEIEQLKREKRELEQELAAAKGETALVRKRVRDAEVDIDLEGSPEEANEARQLEILRDGVDRDLEALDELRSPREAEGRTESALDIVRANNRERAELQERSKTANNLLSRIAATVNLDRWDTNDGQDLLERIAAYHNNKIKIVAKIKALKKEDAADKDPASVKVVDFNTDDRIAWERQAAFRRGQITALEWAASEGLKKAPVDLNNLRRITFVVSGHPVVHHCPPEMTVQQARDEVLGVFYPPGSRERTATPFDTYLLYDESGRALDVTKAMRETPLPTEKIVLTLPAGYGG